MVGSEGAPGAGTPPEVDKVVAPATPAKTAVKSAEKATAPAGGVDLDAIDAVMAATSAETHTETTPTNEESEATSSTNDAETAARASLEESMDALNISVGEDAPPSSDEAVAGDASAVQRSEAPPVQTRRQRRVLPPPPPVGDAPATDGTHGAGNTGTRTAGSTGGRSTRTRDDVDGMDAEIRARRATTPQRPAEEEETVPAPRESVDRTVLDKGSEFFYQFVTGKKGKTEVAQKKLIELGLCKPDGETFNASTRTLFAEAAYTKDKQTELLALEKQLAKEKTPATRAHLESEIRKGKLELEHRLDAMKVAWLDRWKEDNKERNPSLTKKELSHEAASYIARTIFLAATNFYPEHEAARSEAIAQTPQEKGFFRRTLERYSVWNSKQPVWKRALVSGAIAGGTTLGLMSLFSVASVPMIAGVAGYRSLRSMGAVAGAGGITAGIEKLFGKSIDARAKKQKTATTKQLKLEKAAVNEERSRALEAQLRADLEGKEGWLEDRVKALGIMSFVDAEAKKLALERGECFADRERKIAAIGTKWRRNLAIGTGLAVGGGMALSSVDWDHVGTWLTGPKPVVPLHVPTGGGTGPSVLEHARTSVLAWTEHVEPPSTLPELPDPLPIPDATEMNVLTIPHGGSVWSAGHGFIGDTIQGADGPVKVTKEIFNEAWKNSTVDMVTSAGKHIKVPISEVGLVHAGDQVSLTQENGHWVFQVGDYVKDHFKVSNNARFAEILQNNNIPLPRYLEIQTTPPATLVESATAPLRALRATIGAHLTSATEAASAQPSGSLQNVISGTASPSIAPGDVLPAQGAGMPSETVQNTMPTTEPLPQATERAPTGLGVDINGNKSINVPPEVRLSLNSLQSMPPETVSTSGAGGEATTGLGVDLNSNNSLNVPQGAGPTYGSLPESGSSVTPETVMPAHGAGMPSETVQNMIPQTGMSAGVELGPDMSMIPDSMFTPETHDVVLQRFAGTNLFQQEQTIDLLSTQIAQAHEVISTPGYAPDVLQHMVTYNNELIDLQQELTSSPSYLRHIVQLNNLLETSNVAPEFYNNVANMRMEDFMAMSNRLPGSLRGTGTTESIFRVFYEDSIRLRNIVGDIEPSRRELRMTVGQFMKTNLRWLVKNPEDPSIPSIS